MPQVTNRLSSIQPYSIHPGTTHQTAPQNRQDLGRQSLYWGHVPGTISKLYGVLGNTSTPPCSFGEDVVGEYDLELGST